MHHARKKTASRTMTTSSKRPTSGPDIRSSEVETVLWSKINYNLISDIFSHLFTIQQLKYRRVSSAWNSLLLNHLARSAVVSLRCPDLKYWKAMMCPPVRETRLALRTRKIPLVTEKTRRLIIDFASDIPKELYNRSARRSVFGLNRNDEFPLAAVGRYHPQICHVVLCRISEPYIRHYSEQYLTVLVCLSDSMSNLSPNVRVSLCDFAFHCQQGCYMFSTTERSLMKSWKMAWPNVTFKCVKESYSNMIRERSMAYWPYPSNQLTWLSNCLDMLPAEDRLLRFLAVFVSVADVDDFNNFDPPPTFLTLRGNTYAGFTLAFSARYLTTFRPHFNLPPPPYPLIWSDSF